MASKRLLKNRVKQMICEILDDADYFIVSESKNADKADALIDEAVDYHDLVLERINKASDKKDFRVIIEDLEAKAEEFTKKINALNA